MASIEELWLEIENYDKEWAELRPMLVKYLPRATARLRKVDHLLARRRRDFGRASQAEKQGRRVPAFWWYCQVLATSRTFSRLVDEMGERGLEAQEKAKRQRQASA